MGRVFNRGLVSRVEVLGVRNRHAMYKITLVPWAWLMTKSSNYRIFQQNSTTNHRASARSLCLSC